ncbi:hypothetical protein DBB36_14385 [Flavobacterium sp. WLB]|uniref:hypothetical protein n=1 Tax=unclassified Flavobacterium TaxID=196869 RepID=UPI0006ABDBE8|nr:MULTISPECIES: hypothetical protein [unclassified Flavobacterium]KOP39600.1 hypothetical protein AKO67_03330 [Flavobacterium sp. VMW]OWU90151.1 hypothetical protein APR43_13810 [Flavobacterium sp. NLM]PUU69301.1 hypothetical protein DBB36_14385 [Flavobacterium sp. WLB]
MKKTYNSSALNSNLLMAVAILCLTIGATCFFFLFNHSAEISELANKSKKSIFLFLIGGIFFFVLSRKMLPKVNFELSENDITIINRKTKKRKQISIRDITNEVSFYSGKMSLLNLAFQKNDGEEWYIINSDVKNYMELINHFKNLYHEQRTPILAEQLDNGNNIVFKTSTDNNPIMNQMVHAPLSRLSKYNKNTVLSKTKVIINNKDFLFSDMKTVTLTQDGNIAVFSKNGDEMFIVLYSQMTSPDVFLELLRKGLQITAS